MPNQTSDAWEMHTFTLHVHHETDLAILASESGDRADAVWLPISQIEISGAGNEQVSVEIPQWLAVEKDLM